MALLIPILALSVISMILGFLIIMADKFIADYGECRISIAGEEEFTVRGGETLLSYLASHNYTIPSACGGKATCGYCKVKVIQGGGQILPTERGFITPEDIKGGLRLACQVKVKNDMKISLPDFIETIKNIVKNCLYNPKLRWRFRIADQQYSREGKKKVQKKFDADHKEKLYKIIQAYKDKPGSTIPILQNINNVFNYLPEHALEFVSREMKIPYSSLYRISTFYNAFSLKPQGRNIIRVCLGTSCYVKGGANVLHALEKELGISIGQNTPDLKFTLDTVHCIGCCGQSPVFSINDDIFGYLDKYNAIDIVHKYAANRMRDEQVKT